MPLDKNAATVVKNLEELAQLLKNEGKVFKNLKGQSFNSAEELINHELFERAGSGSIFVDALGGIMKKILPKKIRDPVYEKTIGRYHKFQKKLTDFDVALGSKFYSKLSKQKNKNLGNLFLSKQRFIIEDEPNKPAKIIEVGVPMFSTPINKTKDFALPLIGGFVINKEIAKYMSGPKQIDNDLNADTNIIKNSQKHAEEMMEMQNEKIAMLVKKASHALRSAAQREKQLLKENEKLSLENQRLQLEIIARVRTEEAMKLAELMIEKGMIKRSDFDDMVEKIVTFEDDAYFALKEAVEKFSATESKIGVDNLTFLVGMYNIKDSSNNKKSLADSIIEAANEI